MGSLSDILSYVAELVGFAIIAWVIWRKVWPPVKKMADQRQELVRKQVADSALAAQRLAEAERKYQDAVAEAHTEAAKIRDAARADAQRIVEDLREQAEREVVRIRQRGEDDLVQQRQQIIRELRATIGELSVDLAGELVTDQLSSPTARAATVDRMLAELEGMAGGKDTEKTELEPANASSLAGKGDA